MRVKLILMGDEGQRTVYRLKKVPTIIGRGRDADLTLAHPLASRHHCELYEVEGTLCVRDLGSLNGTFVGDFRITEAALESGDLLTIGGAKFEVLVEKDPVQLMPPTKPTASVAAEEVEELEPIEEQAEVMPEVVEEIDESFSDIDFTEAEEVAPPSPPPAAAPTAPAKQQPKQTSSTPAAKSQPKKPAPTPSVKPKSAEPAAPSHSDLDLGNIGEAEAEPIVGEDSGLNSFLRKI